MTSQGDIDQMASDAIDLLVEVRALQTGFEDAPIFGGPGRFDVALQRLRDLQIRVEQAKAGYAGYAP